MLSSADMFGPLAKGFALTFKHLFRKPITINYPEQKMPMFPRYRGKQVFLRIGSAPGSGYDIAGRLLGQYIGKRHQKRRHHHVPDHAATAAGRRVSWIEN